jgi:hypothetical protein
MQGNNSPCSTGAVIIGLLFCCIAVAIVLAVTPLSVSALLAAIVIGALGIEALLAARGGRRSLLSRIGPLP